MPKQLKLKHLLTLDNRISLFQTAMNNSGRNFQGKGVKVKKVADFAAEFYKLAIKEIEKLGQLSIKQLQETIKKYPVRKVARKKTLKKLMRKIKDKNKRKNKRKKRKGKK